MNVRKSRLGACAIITKEKLGSIRERDYSTILSVSRKHDHTDFGLPGGKVDEDETVYEALVREIREETGIAIYDAVPIYFREGHEHLTVVYIVTDYAGDPEQMESGKVEWNSWEVLKGGSFGDYNKNLEAHIKMLINNDTNV